jgi:hypothetical protein
MKGAVKKLGCVLTVTAALAACGGQKSDPPGPASDADLGYTAIGVPECDQYARKYLACLERAPEGSRAMMRQSFDQTRELWGLTAEKPDRRDSLAAACAQQEKASKAAMSRYDCEW